MGELSSWWIREIISIIPGRDGMLQVLGAAWGKNGLELGQLAESVGFCGVLPRMGDGERVASGVLYECSR
jgi:hypothetical protein